MEQTKFKLLHEFVNMYGSRALQGIEHYKTTQTRFVFISTVLRDQNRIVPDMELLTCDQENITTNYDTTTPGTANALAQMQTYNPIHECIIGLAFADGELMTFVVRVKTSRQAG